MGNSLVRDFTAETKELVLSYIQKDQEKNNAHWYSGIQDWVADHVNYHIPGLDVNDYINDMNSYYQKVIDKNDMTKDEFLKIYRKVYACDKNYSAKFQIAVDQARSLRKFVQSLTKIFGNSQNGYGIDKAYFSLTVLIMSWLIDLNAFKKGTNPAVDGIGQYGGNQSNAGSYAIGTGEFNALAAIIRSYDDFKNMSDKEVKEMLEKMGSVGCEYIALVNTIFEQYVGREEDFEKTFGYPMYTPNGELNYNAVFVDLYCNSGATGEGLNTKRAEKIWERFINGHGVDVDVKVVEVNAENFEELSKNGQIIIEVYPLILEDKDGNIVDDRQAGHAMTITGYTDDGRVMVTTWGMNVFYVDLENYKDRNHNITYQQVVYSY